MTYGARIVLFVIMTVWWSSSITGFIGGNPENCTVVKVDKNYNKSCGGIFDLLNLPEETKYAVWLFIAAFWWFILIREPRN